MTKNREKVQETLKMDYKDIDKKYKEQLIKTKVRLQLALCFMLIIGRRVREQRPGEVRESS